MLSGWRTCCLGVSQRWVFVLMAFFAIWLGNALRVIISITITEMVTEVEEVRGTDDTCARLKTQTLSKNFTVSSNRYDWDEYTQGIILSSYFWGYATTQFFFGSLSERFGGKYLLGLSIFIPVILTFAIPTAIEWGESIALIVLRILMGVASGAMYPAASAMISQWIVPVERSKLGSIIFTGGIIGTVFGLTLPAIIIRYSGMGWPAVFYIFGALGIIWFPLWVVMCYNNPQEHPYISEMELKYLQENINSQNYKKIPPPPWKHILCSKQFWAFVVALIGVDWAYFTMAGDLPKYMSDVVKLSIEDNGYLSSLPYLSMWFSSILSSWISDQLIVRNVMSATNVRKLLVTISLTIPAIFLIAASYSECEQFLVVTMFIVGMTFMGTCYPSVMVNGLDLSPNYAGTLMSIGNSIAATSGILTPYIVGVLTPNQTISEWRVVFWIVFVISIITNAYFLIYGSAKVQDWNEPDFIRDKKKTVCTENGKKNIEEDSTCV